MSASRVDMLLLGLAHIVAGALLALGVIALFLFVTMVGVQRQDAILAGLPLDWLAAILLGLGGGVVLGVGLLRGRRSAWFGCALLYFATFCAALLYFFFGEPSGIGPGVAVEDVLLAPAGAVLGSPFGVLAGLLALGGYAYLFLPGVRAHFGVAGGAWRKAVAVHVLLGLAATATTWALTHASLADRSRDRLMRIASMQVANEEEFRFLLEQLEARDPEQRLLAAWALGQTGRTDALEQLWRAAREDADSDVRVNAIAALARLGGPAMKSELLPLLEDPDERVRITALGNVADLEHPEIVTRVGPLLQDGGAELHAVAADVLGATGDPRAAAYLERAVTDSAADVRSRVAFALGRLGQPSSVPPLVGLLDDESWEVRANAAQALGMIGDPAARTPLEPLRDDPHSIVRQAASDALDKLGP